MKDTLMFLKGYLTNPATIGSVIPSSKKLAQQISKQSAVAFDQPKRYLEVGGGSGALSRFIEKNMRPEDSLDIVEIDPKFCAALRQKFKGLPNINIYETSILDFKASGYDIVVSSLPLNSFKSGFVEKVFLKFEQLVKSGGFLSYFEYIGLKRVKGIYLSGNQSLDFKRTMVLKHDFAQKYGVEVKRVWWNFPPARVIHCKMG